MPKSKGLFLFVWLFFQGNAQESGATRKLHKLAATTNTGTEGQEVTDETRRALGGLDRALADAVTAHAATAAPFVCENFQF